MAAAIVRRCFLLLLFVAAAGVGAQTIEYFPSPKVGEVHRLEVRSLRERSAPNRPATSGTAITPVEVKVAAASSKGFVVEWRQGKTRVFSGGQAIAVEDPTTNALLELAQHMVFELEFDAPADFTGLRNYDEVRRQADRLLDRLSDVVAGKLEGDKGRRVMDIVRGIFADRKRLETILLRDVLTYFFPMGKSFPIRNAHSYETVLPNPFGGEPLRAKGSITVDTVDREKALAHVSLRQTVDPDAMRVLLQSVLKSLPGVSAPAPEDLAKIRGEISDQALFVLDLRSGWPLRTEYKRTILVPGRSQIQNVTITRLP